MLKKELVNTLKNNLYKSKNFRLAAKNNPKLLEAKLRVKKYQVNKLKETHFDLLIDPNTKSATYFFLNELYSFSDLTKRDDDLEKLLPMISNVFPESTLDIISKAFALDALTEELDTRMAISIGLNCNEKSYNENYIKLTTLKERETQILLVEDIGYKLCDLINIPLISTTLKIMTIPAKVANLSEIHHFLQNGFTTFKNTKNPKKFVEILIEKEKKVMNELFKS